ncbi:asparaginase [Rhodovulum adriaticum]|uniref:Asparaginase n=1 Tax=Rhodovulum adriaticum TaxID=35804 RepID=A0A4R2P082_RHOAD|nr:asparaginase [Rhodovulum adriaticum]MBK1634987.1 L-asparaginase [Rhodovulum adriaticum]TCP27458.1 asparaginase [Rhodovulum adriaticum]
MSTAVVMVEVQRGGLVESRHRGHAVVCDASGAVVAAWGDPDAVILPRSSVKMIQALPLIESGAADRAGLGVEQLALACASHQGAPLHVGKVGDWLATLGLDESHLRCGAQPTRDRDERQRMVRAEEAPCQLHNNCSGKHAGFLTLTRDLGAGPEYNEIDHPVQVAVRAAFEDVTGAASPTFGIDGCSAPNFATTMQGLARAMARFAVARPDTGDARGRAAGRLVQAMMAHPDLVAGQGRACTELMQAAEGKAAIKTGAEGVFTAILPEQGLGVALKIEDGAARASEAAIAALLVRLGVLQADDPAVRRRMAAPVTNWRGITTGEVRAVPGLF